MDPAIVTVVIALFAASLTWAITQVGTSRVNTLGRLETIGSLAKAQSAPEAAVIETPLSKATIAASNPEEEALLVRRERLQRKARVFARACRAQDEAR